MFYLTPYVHLSNSRCISSHDAALTDTRTVSYERKEGRKEGRKEMFYLTTHLIHFIYCYMASDMW